MNITTHNENRELIHTVSWGDDPATTLQLDGDTLADILGDPYWYSSGYPCWFVNFNGAHFLIRQSFPDEIDSLEEEDNWCVISDFIATAINLAERIMRDAQSRGTYIKIIRKSRVHVGKLTKLPLPDRRTA